MIKERLKIAFILIWILGMLLLALPNFSFVVGEQTINIDYADRVADKIGTSLGNFQQSFGVYEGKEVKAALNFTDSDLSEEVKSERAGEYLSIINNRIQISNLSDVKVRTQTQGESFFLVFTFPDYYNNPTKYVEWLTSKGEISFVTADQTNPVVISINDYDIQGNINLDYLDTIGSHIVLKFKSESVFILQQAFAAASEGNYFLMNIDNFPAYFVIQYDQYSNTNEDLVRILPTQAIEVLNTKERNDYLNITRSYFLNNSLEDSFTVDQNIITIKPLFKNTSATFLAEMFIVVSFVLALVFLRKFGKLGFLKYISAISTFILTFVVALKILSGNISISFIAGFIFVLFLINAILYFLLQNMDEDKIKENLRLIRDYSIFSFILLSLSFKLVPDLGIFADFIGVALVGNIVLFIMSLINFRLILGLQRENIVIKVINPVKKFRKQNER